MNMANFRMPAGLILFLLVAGAFPADQLLAWESDKVGEVNYFYIPDTGLKDEDGKIGMNSAQALASIPISLGEKVFLAAGFDYQGLFVDYRDMNFIYISPDSTLKPRTFTEDDLPGALHALDLVAGCNINWDENWSTYAEFRPGLHSDFKELSGKDVYYQGGAMVSYVFSDEFNLTLGAYYSDEFGSPALFPLVGVQWQISEDLILDTLLPDNLIFSLQAASWLNLGLRGRLRGHQFRLTEGLPWENTVVKYEQILAGPFVDLLPWSGLVIRLEGGLAAMRKFEFRDDDSSEKLYDGDLKEGAYVSASAAWQL